MVCLVWLVIYVTDYHEATRPRRLLTYFVLVCTLLYFCHAWYFLTKEESYGAVDALYMFCNLAVYPLFYCYILMLTKGDKFSFWSLMVLLPSIVFTVIALLTGGHPAVLLAAKAVFGLEVFLVAIFGLISLEKFNQEVRNYYSNPENRMLRSTSVLLVNVVFFVVLSSIANVIGRDAFWGSLLIGIPSLVFSGLLFAVFYVSSRIRFSASDFQKEIMDDEASSSDIPLVGREDVQLEGKIASAMEEKKLFLLPGLKISDVALAVGSNRTYVSNALNSVAKMSFTDYVNSRRIEYAKSRMTEPEGNKVLANIAAESGFSSFPSFYRAFVKFTGYSPSEWLKKRKV